MSIRSFQHTKLEALDEVLSDVAASNDVRHPGLKYETEYLEDEKPRKPKGKKIKKMRYQDY